MDKISKSDAIILLKSYINSELENLKWFKNIKPHVKAIIFYGSASKGTNKPESDLDLLIIVPLKIEEKFTEGEYFYKFQNREINIVLRSFERLRKLAKEQNDKFEAEVFRNSEILFESDSEVKTLLELIKTVKK